MAEQDGAGDNLQVPAEDEVSAMLAAGGDATTQLQDAVDEASRDVAPATTASLPPAGQARVRHSSGRRQGPRASAGRRRRISLAPLRVDPAQNVPPDTEENVQKETKHVVDSFMAYSYERQESSPDQESEGAAAAATRPDMPHCFNLPKRDSPYADIGRRLATIGDDIDRRYRGEFDGWISEMHLTPSTTYDAFAALARRVLEDDFNWGRVVALLSFGFRMAMRCLQTGLSGFVGKIISYLTRFIVHGSLSQWIAQNGGWRAVQVVVEGANTTTVVSVVAVAILSITAAWYFSRK